MEANMKKTFRPKEIVVFYLNGIIHNRRIVSVKDGYAEFEDSLRVPFEELFKDANEFHEYLQKKGIK